MTEIIGPIMTAAGMTSATTAGTSAGTAIAMSAAEQALVHTAAGVTSGAASGMSLGSLLSSSLTLASVGMSVMGGQNQAKSSLAQSRADARALELSARDDELAAKQEELRAKQDANSIMDNLNQTLAAQRLAFSGNGIDPTFGTPDTAAKAASRTAGINMGISRTDAMLRALSRRRQASESLTQRSIVLQRGINDAKNSRLAGVTNALGTASDFALRRINRG